MEKSDPVVLCLEELKTILSWFLIQAHVSSGLRNLVIAMMFGLLGLRLSTLRNIDIQDVSLPESLLWVREKGYVRRPLPMPQILCIFLFQYLKTIDCKNGPLFLSKRRMVKKNLGHGDVSFPCKRRRIIMVLEYALFLGCCQEWCRLLVSFGIHKTAEMFLVRIFIPDFRL